MPLPQKNELELDIPSRKRKPWTGKVHNPRKIWEDEQAQKRSMTAGEFQKFTKEGLEIRFRKLETLVLGLAEGQKSSDEILANLSHKLNLFIGDSKDKPTE